LPCPLRIDDDARFSSLRAKWSIKSAVVISLNVKNRPFW
jgi:hypothetical protein